MTSDPDIETLSSATVFESKWMRVREDRIRRRDGSTGTYGVVDKADFAVVAAIQDGHIHMVEQFRYPIGRRVWELPMGGVQGPTDLTLEQIAHRELREETGVSAGRMERIGRLHPAYGYSSHAFELFLANDLTAGEPAREAEEQDMISCAMPLDEMLGMIRDGRLVDGPTVAAMGLLMLHGRLPV
ncbi:MAG: NUDIX hydrolase [Pseudomonadota bacterium]